MEREMFVEIAKTNLADAKLECAGLERELRNCERRLAEMREKLNGAKVRKGFSKYLLEVAQNDEAWAAIQKAHS